MIKRLRHHLEKDFKHLKHIFACWLAYLILPPVSAELFGISLSIPKLGTDLTELLLVPLLIIWIPLLVQADLTAGKNAFWWTRPISRMEILSAKALYIVIFIICPQLVVNSIYLALKGVVAADIFSAALGIIFRLTVLVLPLWLLAALTTNFKRFVLVVILIPFAGYLFGEVISPFIFRNKYFYIFPQWFFGLFFRGGFILLVNAIFAVILIHQYLTRKTKRSVLLMIS
ncbi:MAG: hypothetical protein GY765_14915, partial [bacterium]|nr:hypothetical protein [bacterium]